MFYTHYLVSTLELLDVICAFLEAGLQILEYIVRVVLHGGGGGGLVHAVVVGSCPPAVCDHGLVLGGGGGLHPHLEANNDIRKYLNSQTAKIFYQI